MSDKKISLASATALSVATMVGSGWLFSSQLSAQYAGNWSFASWLLAGVIVIFIGLCLASVVQVFPVTGSISSSSALSHNKIFGMPFAFSNWFGIVVVVANEAQATGQYLFSAIKSDIFIHGNEVTVWGKAFEVLIVLLYLVINFYGIKVLSRFNNAMTFVKIAVPCATIIFLLSTHFDHSNFSLATNTIYNSHSIIAALTGAGLIYSLNGFQTVASFAEEINNSRRNVPLAMILSVIIVIILYMALQFAFMGSMPHELLVNGWAHINFNSPLYQLAILLNLNILGISLVADSIVSPSGTGCAYLGSTSRMLQGMAKNKQFPSWFAYVSPGEVFSKRALVFNYALATIILLCGDTWAGLMILVTGCNIMGYMAAPVSMGAIKPKNRIFGCFVFIIITLLMYTIPKHDILTIDLVMSGIMIIYFITQIKEVPLTTNLFFTLPFLAYLWGFYLISNAYGLTIVAILFYGLATHKSYVAYCAKYREITI